MGKEKRGSNFIANIYKFKQTFFSHVYISFNWKMGKEKRENLERSFNFYFIFLVLIKCLNNPIRKKAVI